MTEATIEYTPQADITVVELSQCLPIFRAIFFHSTIDKDEFEATYSAGVQRHFTVTPVDEPLL